MNEIDLNAYVVLSLSEFDGLRVVKVCLGKPKALEWFNKYIDFLKKKGFEQDGKTIEYSRGLKVNGKLRGRVQVFMLNGELEWSTEFVKHQMRIRASRR